MSIIIYHTNDMHARISTHDENEASIGIEKISKVVNLTKLKNKNTFYFDAGDLIHGTPRANLDHSKQLVTLLNPSPLDAFVTGNHEYNFHINRLCEISKELKAYVLSANTLDATTHSPILLPYIIYNIDLNEDDYISEDSNDSKSDNIKMGVFGLATPETAYKTNPLNVPNIIFDNPITAAKNIVTMLKNTCDIIIALTHLGLDESSEFTSKRLAEEVEDIDLIIDGHSHTVLEHGLKINNTLIVQTGCHGQYLGKVIINNDIKAELLNEQKIDNIIGDSDKFLLERLTKIDENIDRLLNKKLFYSNKELSGERELVRKQESELGNLTADAIKWFTKADIACVNGGDIRTSLPKGDITYKNILAIFPFQNNICTYNITGKLLKQMFEHSIEFVPAAFGGFLSVSSNVKIIYDVNKICEIYINNELLDLDKTYTLAISEFLAVGGDDYTMLKQLKKVNTYDTIEKILVKYFNSNDIQPYSLGRLINKAII